MDASKKLLILCSEENAKITRYPERPRLMDNGVQHYFVEVTRKDGLQYGYWHMVKKQLHYTRKP